MMVEVHRYRSEFQIFATSQWAVLLPSTANDLVLVLRIGEKLQCTH